MKEIVPEHTPQVIQALHSMGYRTIHRVPVVPRKDCVMSHCWLNVPSVIEQEGGEIVPGQIVWIEASGKWLHLEAHCCWRMPDGTLVDPTPKMDQEQEIAFVEEPLKWEGHFIASRYHSFTNDPGDALLIGFVEQWQAMVSQGQQSKVRYLKDCIAPTYTEVLSRKSRQSVGRIQACPCGSGRKFKRCCGAAK